MVRPLADVRDGKQSQYNNDDYRRHRYQNSQSSGMFRSKIVQRTNGQDGATSKKSRGRQAKILESGERANCCSNNVVGNQQEGADDGDNLGSVTDTGINTAAVRVVPADGHVVHA